MEREGRIRGLGATTQGGKDQLVGQEARDSWGSLVDLIALAAKKIKLSSKTNGGTREPLQQLLKKS